MEYGDTVAHADIWHFRMPFPAELKIGEAGSDIYLEYAQGVGCVSSRCSPIVHASLRLLLRRTMS